VHLRRTTAEPLVWFAQIAESTTSPYPVELLAGGEVRTHERHDRFDVGFEDLSPDGAWVLYYRDDVETPSDYDLKLHLVRRDGTDARQLSPRTLSRGRFSPDGVPIAAIASGATDTLLVLRRDGTAVLEYDLGRRGEAIAWCGDSTLAAIGTVGSSLALLRVGLDGTGQVVAVPALSPNVTCAPDGRHALATIAVEGLAVIDKEVVH
jgi:hypothetical protein